MAITHHKVTAVPDDPAYDVGSDEWNANHDIAAGTITDVEVAAANKDGVAGTASMRTLGAGAQQAAAGNHATTHASTTGQTTDDHHAKSHAHSGADGSGTVAHSATTGITATDHHAAPAAGPDANVTVDAAGAA